MVVAEIVKKALLAGLGAQEKAKEFIDELVKAGELSKSDASNLVKEWTSKAEQSSQDMDEKIKDAVAGVLAKVNIPTKDEFEKLEKKIHGLSARLAKVEGAGGKGEA